MRLRAQLSLTMIPLVLGPLLALGWLSWETGRAELMRETGRNLDAALWRIELDLAMAIDRARSTLVEAEAGAPLRGSARPVQPSAGVLADQSPAMTTASPPVINPSGHLPGHLSGSLPGSLPSPLPGQPQTSAAAPVGDMSLTMSLRQVLALLGRRTPDPDARLLLALPDGQVVYDSGRNQRLTRGLTRGPTQLRSAPQVVDDGVQPRALPAGEVASAAAALLQALPDHRLVQRGVGPGSVAWLPAGLRDTANTSDDLPISVHWDGAPMFARARALAPGLLGVALLPEARLAGPVRHLGLWVLTATLLASLALMLVLFGWLRYLVLRPIERLQATARHLGEGELRAPIPLRTGDEFGRLALTLHEMGAHLADHRQRIEHMAFHDHLTGLPNRRLLRELLADQLRETRRRERLLAVLFVDLDHFKQINDNLGHGAGDELLCTLTRRLRQALEDFAGAPNQRGRIHLARFGGDEFLVTVGELASSALAVELAARLLAAATEPFELGAASYVVTASIGISLYPDDAADADGLIRCADLAMYEAKAGGRNVYRFFSPELDARSAERLGIERRLRQAVASGGLRVHYQPILDLARGRLHGFEALLRWTDAELGEVSPVRFIPVAEETGLIRDLGLLVLDQVCAELAAWRAAGLDPVPVSVNVSAAHLRREDLAGPITERLHRHGLAATDLAVEITESILMDINPDIMQRVQALETIGIALLIDDFGTGYSSLNYLRRFRIQGLKIDRSFVTNICTNAEDRCLATAMIAMAHALNVSVVAEGIEETAQLTLLRELGCDQGQGYLFARPGDAAAATALLQAAKRGGGRLPVAGGVGRVPPTRPGQPTPMLVAARATAATGR